MYLCFMYFTTGTVGTVGWVAVGLGFAWIVAAVAGLAVDEAEGCEVVWVAAGLDYVVAFVVIEDWSEGVTGGGVWDTLFARGVAVGWGVAATVVVELGDVVTVGCG